jgi:hypothetical protein
MSLISNNYSQPEYPQEYRQEPNTNELIKNVVDTHTDNINNNGQVVTSTNNVNDLAKEYAMGFFNMFNDIVINIANHNGIYTKGGRRHSKYRNRKTFKNNRRINHLNTSKK